MTTAGTFAPETTTRDAILDAAERRFAEHGFEGASVREIAADVGLRNQASLYHYFAGKQAIYEAVLARGVDSIVAILSGAPAATVGDDLDRVLDYLVEHPHLARLFQHAGLDDNAFVHDVMPRIIAPLYARGVDLLKDTRAAWSQDEIPHLAAGLYHLIFGYFASAGLLEPILGDDPRGRAAMERQRRFLKKAVARLLGTDIETTGDG